MSTKKSWRDRLVGYPYLPNAKTSQRNWLGH